MLKDETIEKLAGVSRIKAEELKAAIAAEEEQDLDIPQVQTFTDEELNTRISNELTGVVSRYASKELDGATITGDTPDDIIHALGKRVYDDSKSASLEMWVKKYKEDNGLDFQGKSPEDLVKFIKSQKGDTGELEKTIDQLRQNLQTKEGEFEKLKSDYEAKLSGATIRQKVRGAIPDNLVETMNKDFIEKLFLATYDVEMADGKLTVKKDGEMVKDKQLLNPIPLEEVMNGFVSENGWLATARKGRGAGDGKTTPTEVDGIHDSETFFTYLEGKGIKRTSREAVEVLNKLPKEVQERVLAES